MARNPVQVRDARPEDATVLVAMWCDHAETGSRAVVPTPESAARAVGLMTLEPDQRLLVAVVGEQIVGVAHLVRAPLSPIHEDTAVRVSYLFVLDGFRRRGVGRTLLAAATAWADEEQSQHLLVNVSAAARDANRFLARLGLPSVATVRSAPVAALQARLAKFEVTDAADQPVVVERLRTLRRRQATARMARRVPVE